MKSSSSTRVNPSINRRPLPFTESGGRLNRLFGNPHHAQNRVNCTANGTAAHIDDNYSRLFVMRPAGEIEERSKVYDWDNHSTEIADAVHVCRDFWYLRDSRGHDDFLNRFNPENIILICQSKSNELRGSRIRLIAMNGCMRGLQLCWRCNAHVSL